MHRQSKVDIKWSPKFAYGIGLITTDGNLSKDQRHINFTTKDEELIHLFKDCLGLENKIGKKARGGERDKKYYVIQFGDVNFYNFLLSIGLTQAKSRTIKKVVIPDEFFPDFLRGCVDGDGNIGAFKHPDSNLPQVKLRLYSASKEFLVWIRLEIRRIMRVRGGWIGYVNNKSGNCMVLNFGKKDSCSILKRIYYKDVKYFLGRKFKTAKFLVDSLG